MPSLASGTKLRQLAERGERVFPSYPQVMRYFPASSIEDARNRLTRAIDRGEGPGLVIGAPGTGKSLLLQVLAAHYHERFDVVLLACARLCTRRALMQAILFELGLPYKMREEGELRLTLLDHLLSTTECPSGLVLLVDEAQSLPTPLLEELRVLTNLVRGGAPRVRLALAGSSALEENFAHPDLESFSQRLSARCYLAPFNRDDTTRFISAQIAACGAVPSEIFAPDAWDAVFEATDGVPRLVNQLCDRAVCDAASASHKAIDRQVIQNAWADLQQLPTPWEVPPPVSASSPTTEVVEFGTLSSEMIAAQPDDHDMDDDDLIAALTDVPEPTELDEESELETAAQSESQANNPFAETFEEEEVVLDNFAAWDDMFRNHTPRVQNRRDPGFATLVQDAIEATSADSGAAACGSANHAGCSSCAKKKEVPGRSGDADRPPLRLAIVPDASSGEAIGEVASTSISKYAAAFEQMLHDHASSDWLVETATTAHAPLAASAADDALVIVEDDPLPPSEPEPPVRREEYRHLFSRLRSG